MALELGTPESFTIQLVSGWYAAVWYWSSTCVVPVAPSTTKLAARAELNVKNAENKARLTAAKFVPLITYFLSFEY